MPQVRHIRKEVTREQLQGILDLERGEADISRSQGAMHNIDLIFTESDQGLRHLYVASKEGDDRFYHISRAGNAVSCEGAF